MKITKSEITKYKIIKYFNFLVALLYINKVKQLHLDWIQKICDCSFFYLIIEETSM